MSVCVCVCVCVCERERLIAGVSVTVVWPWELIGSCLEDKGLRASSSPGPVGSTLLSETTSMWLFTSFAAGVAGGWEEGSLKLSLHQGFP